MPKPITRSVPDETRVFIVWEPGNAGPAVVEAYSPGQAIEYFLATHGMLRYDDIRVCRLDPGEVHLISQVGRLVNKRDCSELDKHHRWTEVNL